MDPGPDTSSRKSSSPVPPYRPLSEKEAKMYYAGLPSCPPLLARTSTTPWEEPKDAEEAESRLKELGVASSHKISTIWSQVAPEISARLSEAGVQWSSMDVVRIREVGQYRGPVVVWVGVQPNTCDGEVAHNVAFRCLNVLKKFDIDDVDVELRETYRW